jgi:hypothetical protein
VTVDATDGSLAMAPGERPDKIRTPGEWTALGRRMLIPFDSTGSADCSLRCQLRYPETRRIRKLPTAFPVSYTGQNRNAHDIYICACPRHLPISPIRGPPGDPPGPRPRECREEHPIFEEHCLGYSLFLVPLHFRYCCLPSLFAGAEADYVVTESEVRTTG